MKVWRLNYRIWVAIRKKLNNVIYEYKNKYYIKLYPSIYREIKVSLNDGELTIEASGFNTEINNENSVKTVSTESIKNRLKNNNKKNNKSYK